MNCKSSCSFYSAFWLIIIIIINYYHYFINALESPIIEIPNQGKLKGVELSKVRIQKITAYYGIPYAQPPIEQLRFSPPVINPLPNWDDIRQEKDFQPSCLHHKDNYKEYELPFWELLADNLTRISTNMSEDCLYLNIFVPNGSPPSQGFPVIMWFHPGNFLTGIPSIWNPHTLVYKYRVIIVTFSWRLHIMGFFTSVAAQAQGNYGLMDQQAAMRWIKNNIKLFNGNSDNISNMGYGSGAISIGIHMINPESRNFFNKAILMSATLFQPSSIALPDEYKLNIESLAEKFNCITNPASEFMNCLRNIEGNVLIDLTVDVNWRPTIDKNLTNNSNVPFLGEPLKNYFERGEFAQIPILTGYTNMEQALELDKLNITSEATFQELLTQIINDDINNTLTADYCLDNSQHIEETIKFFYKPVILDTAENSYRNILLQLMVEKYYASSAMLLATYTSKEQSTFLYRFDMKPSSKVANQNIPKWIQVPHLFDLIYIWGLPYWKSDHHQHQHDEWETRDKRIAEAVMSFWTGFAKTSDPTENTILPIKWEPFTKDNPKFIILDNNIYMSNTDNVNYKAFEFWNEFYPKVLSVSTQCCAKSNNLLVPYYHRLLYVILLFVKIIDFK